MYLFGVAGDGDHEDHQRHLPLRRNEARSRSLKKKLPQIAEASFSI